MRFIVDLNNMPKFSFSKFLDKIYDIIVRMLKEEPRKFDNRD